MKDSAKTNIRKKLVANRSDSGSKKERFLKPTILIFEI